MSKFFKAIIKKISWLLYEQRTTQIPSPIKICWQRAAERSADFIEQNITGTMLFHNKKELWSHALGKAPKSGLYVECGVFKGDSLRFMAEAYPDQQFFGFDNFTGLSEDWYGHHKPKGAFNLDGTPPNMPTNVTLIAGDVEDTYQKFLDEKSDQKIAFLHIDTDTYSPAKLILQLSKHRFTERAIIVFDELYGYPNWEQGEYAALSETLPRDRYEFIAFAKTQAAIRLL